MVALFVDPMESLSPRLQTEKRRDSCLLTGPPRGTSTAVARQLCTCLSHECIYIHTYAFPLDTYVFDRHGPFISQLFQICGFLWANFPDIL